MTNEVLFEEDPPRQIGDGLDGSHEADSLLLDIEGYEGPIDVLLVMARNQKVDLTKVSILQLARQYLDFIDRAQELQLELAAEYLVMAAWLAYLKSRLLLPRDDQDDEPDAETIAEALQFQLRRLEAMQKAADDLFSMPQLGQDIFPRGMAEGVKTKITTIYDASLFDLLQAYGAIQRRQENDHYELPIFRLMALDVALERLAEMLGELPKNGPYSAWAALQSFIPEETKDKLYVRSSLASTLTAALELCKQGKAEVKQDGAFRPIYLRGVAGNARE